MHISKEFNLEKGHVNFSFVDILTNDDIELFIDPCLIELQHDKWQIQANKAINDYFNAFYSLYRSGASHSKKLELFKYAHEINATKIGYGNGKDGTGNTPQGLYELFLQLDQLHNIKLTSPSDIVVFINDFAEDCMSDMLTNVLFKLLNQFTLSQCSIYNHVTVPMPHEFHYWNVDSHNWESYQDNCLMVNGEVIVLVPKNIVRHNYVFSLQDYFHKIILGRLKEEKNISKRELEKSIKVNNNVYDYTVNSTIKDSTLLEEYHRKIPGIYSDKAMTDDQLDKIAYAKD